MNNATAISLYTDEGEPFMDITTNVQGVSDQLEEGEVVVKAWGENESVIGQLLDSGLFRDTGKRVQCGFAQAQIWEILSTLDEEVVLKQDDPSDSELIAEKEKLSEWISDSGYEMSPDAVFDMIENGLDDIDSKGKLVLYKEINGLGDDRKLYLDTVQLENEDLLFGTGNKADTDRPSAIKLQQ